ncbi:MAG: phasin family protein [Terriglobales bacterium]
MTKSAALKVSARKGRSARAQNASQRTAKARNRNHGSAAKVTAKRRNNLAAETVRETRRMLDAQLDPFRRSQLPDILRGLAERNVAQARELYDGSRNTLQAVVESWQKSFGAAGQSAVALNRKMMDATERNMETSFDLAIGLAGARNLGEVMELQAAYWHKIVGALPSQPKARAARRNR